LVRRSKAACVASTSFLGITEVYENVIRRMRCTNRELTQRALVHARPLLGVRARLLAATLRTQTHHVRAMLRTSPAPIISHHSRWTLLSMSGRRGIQAIAVENLKSAR
jgi:hypothetical protein